MGSDWPAGRPCIYSTIQLFAVGLNRIAKSPFALPRLSWLQPALRKYGRTWPRSFVLCVCLIMSGSFARALRTQGPRNPETTTVLKVRA